ncbi:hypothetical protein EYZ11_000568 [Aspergillus tanneri]|uniref:Cysteine-rich transmembrane CYSTM domain-containing protein n=1 Tax=Aspergillus tanneri TaxID=1220188 RepID=A0A4S3JWV8_9EURO|nr:uncharacterized protein ATNIH1004_004066 [Aspergillus tanneri]KAA8648183.1 hypothetical protein ATNIH1004_004066 [Aspergillus tanneri]THC99989.1 hypothetical protein EYZ11_000568 [Aspergillus tanneri]
MGLFDFLKSSKQENTQDATWDANTLTMQQPSRPAAPTAERVVTEQPSSQDNMKLRGGGEGGEVCCGVCTGLLCFACCEECC